ncbi:hypothetical protein ACO2Q1_07335 [Brevundimonas sp. VNH65]|uniref:hypothetical protein n=1 Tax=Brevundimonas sp. VNH65 TaxID=3400917 RepID=UPI003BFF5DCB
MVTPNEASPISLSSTAGEAQLRAEIDERFRELALLTRHIEQREAMFDSTLADLERRLADQAVDVEALWALAERLDGRAAESAGAPAADSSLVESLNGEIEALRAEAAALRDQSEQQRRDYVATIESLQQQAEVSRDLPDASFDRAEWIALEDLARRQDEELRRLQGQAG